MDIVELEALRSRWRRDLVQRGLDTVDRPDFAGGFYPDRVKWRGVRIVIQPGDPYADAIHFEADFWDWLAAHKEVDVDGTRVSFGLNVHPAAYAAMVVDGHGSEDWYGYLALERSGCIDVVLGRRVAYERTDNNGRIIRGFNLVTIVGYTWAALGFAQEVRTTWGTEGPSLLTVALEKTKDARLTNPGNGWNNPVGTDFEPYLATDPHLLWHIPIADVASIDVEDTAFAIADRIVNAWGRHQTFYLDRTGDLAGELNPGLINRH